MKKKKVINQEIEHYFVIDQFEDGWDIDTEYQDGFYEDLLYDYCIEVLFIPDDKIKEISMTNLGLEIILDDLTYDDVTDDWYTELVNVSKNI